MKFVVLLALVGLASCHTALVGGDRARDVTIEYSYWDDQGKEVTVEVKADKLGLDLSKDDSKLSLKKSSSTPSVSPVHRFKVDDFPKPETRTRFVQVQREPEPVVQRFLQVEPQPAPRPQVQTRFVQVQAEPVPQPPPVRQFFHAEPRTQEVPAVRFVEVDDFKAPEPKTEVRFVQVERESRPEVETRFVHVEAPRPKFETQFVKFEVPRPEFETKFVKVEAPKPKVETRFVQVEAPKQEVVTRFVQAQPAPAPRTRPTFQAVLPSYFQPVRPAVQSVHQFHVPRASSSVHSSASTAGRQRSSSNSGFSDDDNSAEK